jgi:hypothetical protein
LGNPLILGKLFGGRTFPFPLNLEDLLLPKLVVRITVLQPNKEGVLAKLELHYPIMLKNWGMLIRVPSTVFHEM